jgi:hypothetical protein
MSIQRDIKTVHSYWMSTLFDNQNQTHPVAGKKIPTDKLQMSIYFIWSGLGYPVSVIGYLLAVVGNVIKIFVDRIVSKADEWGISSVFVLALLSWMIVGVVVFYLYGQEDAIAFAVSSTISLLFLIISFVSREIASVKTTVVIAYPAAYTAVFLPPVSAALIVPEIASTVFPLSTDVANYILNSLVFDSLENFLRSTFNLIGFSHLILWSAISVTLGWLTGISVKSAELVYKDD